MNIFQVLSQGKSRLHEPSMSAMLAYLLDSNKDHGLGDAFIRVFLSEIDKEVFSNLLSAEFINAQASLEEPYLLGENRKDIDIEILLLDANKVAHTIIIENKIKTGAANPKQLNDYYGAILQDEPEIKNLYIVFLTPESSAPALKAEYDNLQMESATNHFKKWFNWDSTNNKSIISLIKDVLALESNGGINPINEYMRHTLKAFIRHINLSTQIKNPNGSRAAMRVGEDLGEILEETTIILKDGESYRVVRRDSTQIQVFNIESGEKELARTILGKYIDENNLNIPYKELNTRQVGARLFKKLNDELNILQ